MISALLVSEDMTIQDSRLYALLTSLGRVEVLSAAAATTGLARACQLIMIDASTLRDPENLTRRFRLANPALPIVVMTALPNWELARRVYMAGGECLSKHLDETNLRLALLTVLNSHTANILEQE
jgi:hypothetical protein